MGVYTSLLDIKMGRDGICQSRLDKYLACNWDSLLECVRV